MMRTTAHSEVPAQDAFSKQAPVFDELDAENPLITWVRDRVRNEAMRHMRPGSSLLELNAGTGIDSVHFAQRGIRVTATDNAPGMLAELRTKRDAFPALPLEVVPCSFLELGKFEGRSFDHVFSNFGGLNCTDRLDIALAGIERALKPGGTATLVIMPRISPWELVEVFRGHFKLAFRRFGPNGAMAQVEDVPFRCWYYSTGYVRRHMPGCEVHTRMALSFYVPPPHLMPFAQRHPRLVRVMEGWEDRTCRWPIIRSWGDHFVITLKKR